MSAFIVRGWCPDAWHPMEAGDGQLMRIKPKLGRLIRDDLGVLHDVANTFGNGMIDITRRANLQIRGVREDGWPAMLDRLIAQGLVDSDPVAEARRNLLIAPDWQHGDDTHRIALALLEKLDRLPPLPSKVGFVIDAGAGPILTGQAADFRIERGQSGGLILRAEGRASGVSVDMDEAADALVGLAQWFADSGGAQAGRMAKHLAQLPDWASGTQMPATPRPAIVPGACSQGMVLGVPFGSLDAVMLSGLVGALETSAVRVTPWRQLLIEGALQIPPPGFSTWANDPLNNVEACPGAPFCPQATVPTRDLARRIAPYVQGRLHVSGCAKGCARSGASSVMVTGRNGRFDLSFDARADATAAYTGLDAAQVLARLGAE